jgi:hypothetical protein
MISDPPERVRVPGQVTSIAWIYFAFGVALFIACILRPLTLQDFVEKSCDLYRKILICNDFIVSVVTAGVARTSQAISLLAWSPACRKRRAGG